jgi:hypothetical protein
MYIQMLIVYTYQYLYVQIKPFCVHIPLKKLHETLINKTLASM